MGISRRKFWPMRNRLLSGEPTYNAGAVINVIYSNRSSAFATLFETIRYAGRLR
jgi:hypothetical protein